MNKTVVDLSESHIEQYQRDYDNDVPPLKFLLWFFPLFALGGLIFALIVYSVVGAQENESSYPLRFTSYDLPPTTYYTWNAFGATEHQLTEAQAVAFADVVGIAIPYETMHYLANTKITRCERFCYETGYLHRYRLITWSSIQFGDSPALDVFANDIFPDYYLVMVYKTYQLGVDGNTHPVGYWWVRVEDFNVVFSEF